MPLKHLALAVALLTVSTALAADVAADNAALARVQDYVAALRTLRADSARRSVTPAARCASRRMACWRWRKPGRFRWDYRNPAEQLLVSDGETVWLYDVDLAQVTVRSVGQSLSNTPAMLLSGTGNVAETFDVAADGSADGLDWVQLKPKLDDTDFRSVRLGFAGKELIRMELSDRLGQTTRIQFTRIERNPALEPELFSFTPPAGVDVVGAAP